MKRSGWQRVADRLADGGWHSSYELTHELDVMAHSRVAQLRDKGYTVDRRPVAGAKGLRAHEYRLVATPDELTEQTTGMVSSERLGQASTSPHETPVAVSVGSSGAGKVTEATGCLTAEPPAPDLGQLNLWDSAAAPRARAAA